MRTQIHNLLEERVELHEKKLHDLVDTHGRKLSVVEAGHIKLKASYDELSGLLRGERSKGESNLGKLDERLLQLEGVLSEDLERCSKELEAAQGKIRELGSKFEQTKAATDSNRATVDQRLVCMENLISESAGNTAAEWTKDMEKRLYYLQEDQKRARDVLESSLQEQLRLEHSARDAQAQQMK
jgi:hypothetical protein